LTPGEGQSLLPGIAGSHLASADVLGGAASPLNLPDGDRTTTIESKTHFANPAWPRHLLQAR
jgi:acyl-coenzyme A thioesterase PaaI-like protein